MSVCVIDGCGKSVHVKKSGLCNNHSTRAYRYSDATTPHQRKRVLPSEITCTHCATVFLAKVRVGRPVKYCAQCVVDRVWFTNPRKPRTAATAIRCPCGQTFTAPTWQYRKFCDDCSSQRSWAATGNSFRVTCADCGEAKRDSGAPRKQGSVYACQECRRKRTSTRTTGSPLDRARHYGVEYEPVDKRRVFARDKWRCGICAKQVDKRLKFPNPLSPSLDHVVPMSRGGGHTYANTQCAHLGCNAAKQAGGHGEQLALIG